MYSVVFDVGKRYHESSVLTKVVIFSSISLSDSPA